jgi:hypothetical protein
MTAEIMGKSKHIQPIATALKNNFDASDVQYFVAYEALSVNIKARLGGLGAFYIPPN